MLMFVYFVNLPSLFLTNRQIMFLYFVNYPIVFVKKIMFVYLIPQFQIPRNNPWLQLH